MKPPKGQPGKPLPRTRTFRRIEGGSATEGFDAPRSEAGPPRRKGPGAGSRKEYGGGRKPARSTWNKVPVPPGGGWSPPEAANMIDRAPDVAPGAMVELTLRVPAPLLRQLEARAREAGIEVQPLVAVWLAEKIHSR
ncbi:MAG: BrnA antitoxin family protein [Cyanobacteria bacterium REEB65]|nr:BrnA antitoxin family protein [Cyanobacteria bacterium REEB65]